METARKLVIQKLTEMRDRPKEVRRVFDFTMEDLQDNGFEEISSYVAMHRDKISDFWIESYFEEHTFRPKVVVHMILNEEWAKNIGSLVPQDEWLAKAMLKENG